MNKYFPLSFYYKRNNYLKISRKLKDVLSYGFNLFDVDYALLKIKSSKSDEITQQSKRNNYQLWKYIGLHNPSYKKFLERKNSPGYSDKTNYLSNRSMVDLLPRKVGISNAKIISVSSGSSGKPFFWPREEYLELETTMIHEMLLKDIFKINEKSTLFINAYSMGMYVAGIFTNNAITRIAMKGYKISIINPGIAASDIIRIIREIGIFYDQIVIAGYPPFIKDIIELGLELGVNWSNLDTKFIFGAEAISEEWRTNLFELASVKDYFHSSFNTYGSADLAILGHETPISVMIKKIASKNKILSSTLFRDRTVVSFVQYHPFLKFFENLNGELVCSGMGGIPLYKYNLHDEGCVYDFDEIMSICYSSGVDIEKEVNKYNISPWRLPFIVLFGKSDQTITLYGLNIYPQTVRKALDGETLRHIVTGRSTMETKFSRSQKQYVEIIVELAPRIEGGRDILRIISEEIVRVLRDDNYEYNTLFGKIGRKALPKIKIVQYGKISHNRGTKQQWIKKNLQN